MPALKELDPTVGPAARFGADLRKYRLAAGMNQSELGKAAGYSKSRIGNVERGDEKPTREMIIKCEEVLGLNGELLLHWPNIHGKGSPEWFREWPPIERRADAIMTFAAMNFPGLVQTEEYARAVFEGEPNATPELVEESVKSRLERQAIFNRGKPLNYLAVLDEGLLYRPLGGDGVVLRQLEHLIRMVEQRLISVQLLPYEARCAAATAGLMVLALEGGVPIAASVESALRGTVVHDPKEVAALVRRLDTIRRSALPEHLSIRRFKERVERGLEP
ncbi:helix-turn-helix domain-containing protein [Nonomuraea jiangxiensis]|uniref:DNA-binding transcriptional regulator, XRE-family HTH domain n=1 Tax=Nonomuraea jiangxiensis TaxID=633440 RepID=A0A1G8UR62_9ACTN|nr:helix-turn-helix transcriptional regulator [Nonomuraea jiangxiensis]SDJ56271.1 DNA-binding transcriptional regulator, XRE-family HTH domain [Nonomuraea jiangxiensis]